MGKQMSPSHLSRANRLRRLQPKHHQNQNQNQKQHLRSSRNNNNNNNNNNNSSSRTTTTTTTTTRFWFCNCSNLCTTGTLLKIFFLAVLILMNLLSIQYWHQVQYAEHEFEQSLKTTFLGTETTTSTSAVVGVMKVRSGKVVIDDTSTTTSKAIASATTTTAATNINNNPSSSSSATTTIDFSFPNSLSRNDQLKCNDYTSYSSTFLTQQDAKDIVDNYATQVKSSSQRPRFVPVLLELLKAATQRNSMLLTIQLGGMDGKTGDPFFRMTELYKDSLKHWLPVVIEPVPMNFAKLVDTYKQHQMKRELDCGHLLMQLINYDPKQESPPGKCGFCHFDEKSTKCHDIPSWQKYEIGSMECDRKAVETLKDCFTRSEFDCGKIIDGGLSNLNLMASQIAVLQIDVEGFEKQVLEGFFNEINDPKHYPPVINFENKILLGRKILQPVYDLLRNKGYSLHEKRTDTLCLLDHKGDTFLDK